ncbi:MAG: serine hydrolase [Candidatus Nanopelagicales bacterium]
MPQDKPVGRRGAVSRAVTCCLALVLLAGCSGSGTQPAPGSAAADSTTDSSGRPAASRGPARVAEISAAVTTALDLALDAGERYDKLIKSVLVTVDGQAVYERYSADSGPDVTHNAYSVTKSVMSMLIGIAIDEGAISGVDRTLAQLLPDYVPIMAPGVGQVTLEQVLTMTGGILDDDTADTWFIDVPDWVTDILSTPMGQPAGTGFAYSSRGSHLLAAILQQATGQPVLDFAREKLFHPMGIATEPADQSHVPISDLPAYDRTPGFGWSTDPQGLNLGFSDLKITAPDMVKLGRLYLDGGQWQGAQVVPAAWVATSTTNRLADTDPNSGYGYQWWVFDSGGHPAFAAMGHAGQLIHVVPDLGLVVAVSCLDGSARFDGASFASIVETYVIPAIESRGIDGVQDGVPSS